MREVTLTFQARADLIQVWHYTHKQWGEVQADRYLRQLQDRIAESARSPERGKSLGRIRLGFYSTRVGRHIIAYTFDAQAILIQRVLHDQMDVEGNLH